MLIGSYSGKETIYRILFFLLFISINNTLQHGGIPYHLMTEIHGIMLNPIWFGYAWLHIGQVAFALQFFPGVTIEG